MSILLFRTDPYLQEARGQVLCHSPEGGIQLDQSLFFPTGGGQPGDSGHLVWEGRRISIATTTRAADGAIILVPGQPEALPPPGAQILQQIDWPRRYRHMRMHTALHLLAAVMAHPVEGGQIGSVKSRLDFRLPGPVPDRSEVERRLNLLIGSDLRVTESLVSAGDLAAQPALLQALSLRSAPGHGHLRLIGIGEGSAQIDLQPCSGTHVARIGEIGRVIVEQIARKARNTHRVTLRLDS